MICDLIRNRREAKGLVRKELAYRSGVSIDSIKHLEDGMYLPKL